MLGRGNEANIMSSNISSVDNEKKKIVKKTSPTLSKVESSNNKKNHDIGNNESMTHITFRSKEAED